jgi:chromosome segregation ATPase
MNESTDTSQQLIADYEAKIKALTEDRDVWKDAAQQISKAFTAMKEQKTGEPSRVAELEEELKKVEADLLLSGRSVDRWKNEKVNLLSHIEQQNVKIKKLKKAFLKMV